MPPGGGEVAAETPLVSGDAVGRAADVEAVGRRQVGGFAAAAAASAGGGAGVSQSRGRKQQTGLWWKYMLIN